MSQQSPHSPDKYLITCIQHSMRQRETIYFYLTFCVFYHFLLLFFLSNSFPDDQYILSIWWLCVLGLLLLFVVFRIDIDFHTALDTMMIYWQTKPLLLRQQLQLEAMVNIYVSSDSPPIHKLLCHYAPAATSVCCLVLRVWWIVQPRFFYVWHTHVVWAMIFSIHSKMAWC